MLQIRSLLVSALIVALGQQVIGNGHRESPAKILEKLEKDFFGWMLKEFPEFATHVGSSMYQDKLTEWTVAAYTRRKNKCDEFLKTAADVENNHCGLTATQQLNLKVLKDMLVTFKDAYRWRMYGAFNPINFMNGIHQDFRYLVAKTVFLVEKDFEKYLTRLQAIPKQIDDIIGLMKESIRLKTTHHKMSVMMVPMQLKKILGMPYNVTAFYKPFMRIPNTSGAKIDPTKFGTYRGKAKTVITTKVFPALKKLHDFIGGEYMNKTRKNIAVTSLPNGIYYYKACIRWYLSENKAPRELHKMGEAEVAKIEKEMNGVITKMGFKGSLEQFLAGMPKTRQNYFNSSEEIIQEYEKIIFHGVRPKLSRLFQKTPNIPLTIKQLPLGAKIARYIPNSKSFPAILEVDASNPKLSTNYKAVSISLHNVEPGNHFRVNYIKDENLPEYRLKLNTQAWAVPLTFPDYKAYSGGWNIYSEGLGEELGAYTDPYQLIGRYQAELFRACQLVIDTGIHAMGWSKGQAVNYLMNKTGALPFLAEGRVSMFIMWPGSALSEKYGELTIQRLRHKAKDKMGARFNIKEFHDKVLSMGAVPLNILEKIIEDWIVAAKPVICGGPTLHGLPRTMYISLSTFLAFTIHSWV